MFHDISVFHGAADAIGSTDPKYQFSASLAPTVDTSSISTRANRARISRLPPVSDGLASRPSLGGETDVERFIAALELVWRVKEFAFRREIANRLITIRSACIDEQLELSLDSVEQWVRFLARHPCLPLPRLAITDAGNVRASWSPDHDHHFALEFAGDGQVKFVMFAPRIGRPAARIAGIESEARILAHAVHSGVNWLA